MIGGKRKACQHEELIFMSGAFILKCLECKGEWFAVPEPSEAYAYEESRKKEWIQNTKRAMT